MVERLLVQVTGGRLLVSITVETAYHFSQAIYGTHIKELFSDT